jgi:hypothetical protein
MKMKGSMEGVLPMLGVLILAFAMGIQSIPITEAFADLLEDSTGDLERTVNTRAYSDFYYYNYIPLAAKYAFNDASFELGKNREAGIDDWNNNLIRSRTYSSLIAEIITNVEKRADYKTDNSIESVISGSEGMNCKVEENTYNITLHPQKRQDITFLKEYRSNRTQTQVGAEVEVTDYNRILNPLRFLFWEPQYIWVPWKRTSDPINTTCSYSGSTTNYFENTSQYITNTETVNNRYTQLADETVKFFKDLRTELNTATGNYYRNVEKACAEDPPPPESVEPGAVSNLESAIRGIRDSVESNYPERPGFEIEISNFVTDGEFDYGTSSEVADGSSRTSTWSGDCCQNCGEDAEGEPEDWEYRDVEVTPELSNLTWEMRDEKIDTIVKSEYKDQRIKIDPYTHNYN